MHLDVEAETLNFFVFFFKDESNVTIQDYNEVLMLDPKESEAEDSGQTDNVNKAFETFQKKQQWRALQRK